MWKQFAARHASTNWVSGMTDTLSLVFNSSHSPFLLPTLVNVRLESIRTSRPYRVTQRSSPRCASWVGHLIITQWCRVYLTHFENRHRLTLISAYGFTLQVDQTRIKLRINKDKKQETRSQGQTSDNAMVMRQQSICKTQIKDVRRANTPWAKVGGVGWEKQRASWAHECSTRNRTCWIQTYDAHEMPPRALALPYLKAPNLAWSQTTFLH